MTQQTRITLRNFKHAAFASEETQCFEATVLFDGAPICRAQNDGHGGGTYWHPVKGAEAKLAEAEAFAKSLPDVVTEFKEPDGRFFSYPSNLEHVIDQLVGAILNERYARRLFANAMKRPVFIRGGQLYSIKLQRGVKLGPDVWARVKAANPGVAWINEMPPEEGFKAWAALAFVPEE